MCQSDIYTSQKTQKEQKSSRPNMLLCTLALSHRAGAVTGKTGKHNGVMEGVICQSRLCCHTISSRTVGRPNIQVPLHREANLVCGCKWSRPNWPVTSLACEATHCPPRQPADGGECCQVLRGSDNIIISVLIFIPDLKGTTITVRKSSELHQFIVCDRMCVLFLLSSVSFNFYILQWFCLWS